MLLALYIYGAGYNYSMLLVSINVIQAKLHFKLDYIKMGFCSIGKGSHCVAFLLYLTYFLRHVGACMLV